MFTKPRPDTIACDEGWQVTRLSRDAIQYTEGERTMRIASEMLCPPTGLALYARSIRNWKPPHDREVLEATDRERIVENVRRAYKFVGYDIHVHLGSDREETGLREPIVIREPINAKR